MTSRWKTVRIFISSTFEDMHAERDYLVKRVFPELREWCEERKLHLAEIDLRWGVREEDTRNGKVVEMCLQHIDKARPFFLCLLGQRRGWVPEEKDIPPSTLADNAFPGLKGIVGKASVTEMEILHAVINPLHKSRTTEDQQYEYHQPAKYILFYLRDPTYLSQLPSDFPAIHRVFTNTGIKDDQVRSASDQEMERWAKEIIPDICIKYKRPNRHYVGIWDLDAKSPELILPYMYPSPTTGVWEGKWADAGIKVSESRVEPSDMKKAEEYNRRRSSGRLTNFECDGMPLSQVMIADLQRAIMEYYPEHVKQDYENELQKELDQQEQFLSAIVEEFIDRENDFVKLDDYAGNDSSQLFVLTAASGMGKSTLLAKWIDRYSEKVANQAGASLHYRFIGQSERSTTVDSLLYLLLLEIKNVAEKITNEIPEDPHNLRQELLTLLDQAGKKGKTIIILDALDQFETGLSDLTWLPYHLPPNVKLILSFKSGEQSSETLLQFMQGRVTQEIIKKFTEPDHLRGLAKNFLSQYLKQLDENLLSALITLPAAANPLYLKVILSELRVFGSFIKLTEKISSDFGDTPEKAFQAILRRLESDPAYSPLDPHQTVPLIFGLLAHSRHGLSPEELSGLLHDAMKLGTGAEERQAALDTVHLYVRQVRPFLSNRNGRYDYFFESFREAARNRYTTPGNVEGTNWKSTIQWHSLLADYFERLPAWQGNPASIRRKPTLRRAEVVPFHLYHAGSWDRLNRILSDPIFIEAKCEAGLVTGLLEDYETALQGVNETSPAVEQYSFFIRKHAQRLSRLHGLLSGLIMREGFEEAQQAVRSLSAQGPWTRPWLGITEIWKGKPDMEGVSQGKLLIETQWLFKPPRRLASLAVENNLVFFLRNQGQIGVVDLAHGCELTPIPYSTNRDVHLKALITSPNGRYVTLLFKDRSAIVLKFEYGDKGSEILNVKDIYQYQYLLPEYEKPVVILSNHELIFQDASGAVDCVTFQPEKIDRRHIFIPVDDMLDSELRVALLTGRQGLLGFRSGRNIVLIQVQENGSFKKHLLPLTEISCYCNCGPNQFALACINQKITAITFASDSLEVQEIDSEETAEQMVYADRTLYWTTRMGNVYQKKFDGMQPVQQISLDEDPSLLGSAMQITAFNARFAVLTPHIALLCRLEKTGYSAGRQLLAAFIPRSAINHSTPFHAVELYREDIRIIDGINHRELHLIKIKDADLLHQYKFCMDGNDLILGEVACRQGILWDPGSDVQGRRIPLPELLTAIAGNPSGGFWLVDQHGTVCYLDQAGEYKYKFNLELHLTGQPRIYCNKNLLVLFGTHLQESDFCNYLLLYKTGDTAQRPLEVIGRRLQSKVNVLALTYDPEHNRLYVVQSVKDEIYIATGTPEEFIQERESIRHLPEVKEMIRFASLTPDGTQLYLLSRDGNLFLIDTDHFDLLAVLSGSVPITLMSEETQSDGSLLLVEGNSRVLLCRKTGEFDE